jgi:hypothetical protein
LEVKRPFCLIVTVFSLLSILAGCKDRPLDSLTVLNRYFAALEKGDIEEAYTYLCDQSIVIKAPGGEEMRFEARPEPEVYKPLLEKTPRITVTEIKRLPEFSLEGKLEVFQITARTKERGSNVERSSAQFVVYLGLNSEGRWSVLIPATARVTPQEPIADTAALGL